MEDGSEYNTPGGEGSVFDADITPGKQHSEVAFRNLFRTAMKSRYVDADELDLSLGAICSFDGDTIPTEYPHHLPLHGGGMTSVCQKGG
jgi:hypothetical protein